MDAGEKAKRLHDNHINRKELWAVWLGLQLHYRTNTIYVIYTDNKQVELILNKKYTNRGRIWRDWNKMWPILEKDNIQLICI